MASSAYPSEIQSLPVTPYLDQICSTLTSSPSRFLILTAQTAAGKSTAVPLALLQHFPGKILMNEPRRLAAVAIANRVASLLHEETGSTAGYRLHLENRVSSSTRLEVITEAILTRRLQNDPSLEGVSVVVLDEFHERSIHADLALAFLKEAMALRDDLYVIIMSATMDTKTISAYLDGAPVMEIPGRQFPVDVEYKADLSPAQAVIRELSAMKMPADGAGNTNDRSLASSSILVFLPGIADIRRVKTELEEKLSEDEAQIMVLHSSIPLSEQKAVLSPPQAGEAPRVILSSAIAETSLTVPGVTTVIDSGLCRMNTMDVSLGMEKLVTCRESLFSAEQRSGRAGRIARGKAVRLWNQHDVLEKRTLPEILRSDLVPLVLECAQWGAADPAKIDWLDTPPLSAWKTSSALLEELGFIEKGKITARGKAALTLGVHPRIAATLLEGLLSKKTKEAVRYALEFSSYAQAAPKMQERFSADLERRLEAVDAGALGTGREGISSAAFLLLAGFPDRIAVRTEEGKDGAVYQFPSGRKARLSGNHAYPRYLVAPEVDAGSTTGRIYAWEALPEEEAVLWLSKRASTSVQTRFSDDSSKNSYRLVKTERTAYGAIVLKEKKLATDSSDFASALETEVKTKGLSCLPLGEASLSLLTRTRFYLQNARNADADRSEIDTNYRLLVQNPQIWLTPFITDPKSLNEQTIFNALHWFLKGEKIDSEVPVELRLPNGRKRRLVYEVQGLTNDSLASFPLPEEARITPVLEVIIQQIFGCFETPKVLGVPVLLKLLSPARRPLQITQDLAGFWNGSWLEICKEMKGRYPKHNWDYRVAEDD